MTHQTLTRVFMWCTIINGVILALWSLIYVFGGDRVYEIHSAIMPLERDDYNHMMFGFIGLYKILVYVFSVVPWLALLITGRRG